MASTRIKVTIGRTINMGNYESMRLEEGMELDIEEGESISEARIVLLETLENQIDKDARVIAQRIRNRGKV
jgi:hypothetical protein